MVRRIAIVLSLLALTQPAAADIGTGWIEHNPPAFQLVADLVPAPGLEAMYFDDLADEYGCVSLTDFTEYGVVPSLEREGHYTLFAADLDGMGQAELLLVPVPGSRSREVPAYRHDGTSWTRLWNTFFDVLPADLQYVNLNGRTRGGDYVVASGSFLAFLDPADGRILWSSRHGESGLGPDWSLTSWTLADYDQDASGDQEILAEFQHLGDQGRFLLLLDEVAGGTSPVPLRGTAIALGQSRPNPTFGETTVAFELPTASHVRLNVYDVRGRRVATLADRTMAAGPHLLHWNSKDVRGAPVAHGVYFYELVAGGERRTRKMMVVR